MRETQMQRHQDVEISATGEIQDNNRVDLLVDNIAIDIKVTGTYTLRGFPRPARLVRGDYYAQSQRRDQYTNLYNFPPGLPRHLW